MRSKRRKSFTVAGHSGDLESHWFIFQVVGINLTLFIIQQKKLNEEGMVEWLAGLCRTIVKPPTTPIKLNVKGKKKCSKEFLCYRILPYS